MKQTRNDILKAILEALPKFKYKGWRAAEDEAVGSFYFYNEKNDVSFFATPFWETCRGIPFEDYERNIFLKVPFILSGNIEKDVERYFNFAKSFIKENKYKYETNAKRN